MFQKKIDAKIIHTERYLQNIFGIQIQNTSLYIMEEILG